MRTQLIGSVIISTITLLGGCYTDSTVSDSSPPEQTPSTPEERAAQRTAERSAQRRDAASGTAPNDPTVISRAPASTTRRVDRRDWPSNRSGASMTWNSMAFPTGDVRTSVIGIERGTPREVRTGESFDYEIIVTNLTGYTVSDVMVTEQLNDRFTLSTAAPQADMNEAGVVRWNIGDLEAGQSKVIRVTGVASGVREGGEGGDEGQINACSKVEYTSAMCTSLPIVAPRLTLTKTAVVEPNTCDEITYQFEVSNLGSGTIENVMITDALPDGLRTIDDKQTVQIAAGSLASGQSKKFTSRVRASEAGVYENQARAEGDGLTADSSMVSVTVRRPTLTVDVECPPDALIGRELTYTFTVTNTGELASRDTTLSAALPRGVSVLRVDNDGRRSSGGSTWNLGTLEPGATRTLTATAQAASAGSHEVTATIRGACGVTATDSCSIAVAGVPDIGTSITDETGVRSIGENHTFTYVVKNQGQVDLSSVTLDAALSDGLVFVSSTAPSEATVNGSRLIWNLGTLRPGQELTFTITCTGTSAGEHKISTTTKAGELERSAEHEEQVTYIER